MLWTGDSINLFALYLWSCFAGIERMTDLEGNNSNTEEQNLQPEVIRISDDGPHSPVSSFKNNCPGEGQSLYDLSLPSCPAVTEFCLIASAHLTLTWLIWVIYFSAIKPKVKMTQMSRAAVLQLNRRKGGANFQSTISSMEVTASWSAGQCFFKIWHISRTLISQAKSAGNSHNFWHWTAVHKQLTASHAGYVIHSDRMCE